MNVDFQPLAPGAKVLVTGATGFTGRVLTRQLAEAGADIRAIARASSDLTPLADLPIRWFRGDVFDPEVIRAAMPGVEYIFHVAALYREARHNDEQYWKVHVRSTRELAQAAAGRPGFRRFVHVSTIGVHGHIEHPPADENCPFHPGDIYQRTKAEAETWLREFAPGAGLPYTVIRPAAIYGPGDDRLFKVFRMAARGWFPLLGRGRCLYHLIHVEDLAAALRRAATHPAAPGEAFICGNPEPIRLEDMGRQIAAVLGRKLHVLRLPVGPVFFAADLCEAICRPLRIEPPIYRRRVAFYTKDRAFDTRKIREVLGMEYRYTMEAGLRQTTEWYVNAGWLKGGRRPASDA